MYKLKVDRDRCNACGMCALDCNALQEDATGKVEVVGEGIVSDSDIATVRNVVELCPENALTLTEEFVDMSAKLAELKSKMKRPLQFTPPSADEYEFSLEDKDEYAKAIDGSLHVSGEYEYDYKSSSSAESAGERAFRDEIYSQAEALAQQVIVMYEQRKMNRVARYAETSGNYKYGVHQRLIKNLRAFVNELETCAGKKLSLPSDFFTFRTRDTEYINDRQEKSNDWLAGRIKEHLKPASEFYSCVKTEKDYEYVTVSHWFGDDTREKKYTYAYYLSDGVGRFYRDVARATWKAGKYTKQFCERELDAFHKAIEQEWLGKIDYLLRQVGDSGVKKKLERRISTVTEREISSEENSFRVLTPAQAKQRYDDAENYFYGWSGRAKDQSHAVKLYRDAAVNGNVLAQYRLACCYENGDGVQMNLNEARKWYASAAANGHSGSEFKLAKLGGTSDANAQELYQRGNEYFYGWNGRAVDKEIARQLYVKAANAGHVGAHNQLAKHFD